MFRLFSTLAAQVGGSFAGDQAIAACQARRGGPADHAASWIPESIWHGAVGLRWPPQQAEKSTEPRQQAKRSTATVVVASEVRSPKHLPCRLGRKLSAGGESSRAASSIHRPSHFPLAHNGAATISCCGACGWWHPSAEPADNCRALKSPKARRRSVEAHFYRRRVAVSGHVIVNSLLFT